MIKKKWLFISKNQINKNFDFDVFKRLENLNDVQEYLLATKKFLACGQSRAIFDFGDQTVIKVAVSSKFQQANKDEINMARRFQQLAPYLIDYDGSKYNWMIVQKVLPLSRRNIQNITGLPPKLLVSIVHAVAYKSVEDKSKLSSWHQNKMLKPVFRIDKTYDYINTLMNSGVENKLTRFISNLRCMFSQFSDDEKAYIVYDLIHRYTNYGYAQDRDDIVILDFGIGQQLGKSYLNGTNYTRRIQRLQDTYQFTTNQIIEARRLRLQNQ